MKSAIIAVLVILLASPLRATAWASWNGKTVGSSSGNVVLWDAKTIGTATGNLNSWNGLTSPSGSCSLYWQSLTNGNWTGLTNGQWTGLCDLPQLHWTTLTNGNWTGLSNAQWTGMAN